MYVSQRNQATAPEVSLQSQDGFSGHTDFLLWFSLPATCFLLRNYKNIILTCHLWHWAVSPRMELDNISGEAVSLPRVLHSFMLVRLVTKTLTAS